MSRLPRLATALVAVVLLTACGSGGETEDSPRPSVEKVDKAFAAYFSEVDPDATKDPNFNVLSRCYAETLVESDLSDDLLKKLVDSDFGYSLTAEENDKLAKLDSEKLGECLDKESTKGDE